MFTYAGVSRLEGKMKIRWANSADRVAVLIKCQHTDIDLIQLRHPMTKDDALRYLFRIDFDNGNAEVRATMEAEARKRKLADLVDIKPKKLRGGVVKPNSILAQAADAKHAAAKMMVQELAEAGVVFAEA